MDLAPLSSSTIAPSTTERLAYRSMNRANSARPPGARVRRTPATATEGPSVIGAQPSRREPRGQTWLPVSEPIILNRVFDFPEEKPETGPVPAKPHDGGGKFGRTRQAALETGTDTRTL